MDASKIIDLFLDNFRKMAFPEEWLDLDRALSKQEIFALLLINRHSEIIMSQIAEYVNISMSTATGIIDRLVKNGYCERHRRASDRRIVVITLTQKAKKIIEEVKNLGSGYFEKITNALTAQEQQFLMSIITKIIKILSEEREKAAIPVKKEAVTMQKISIE